MKILQNHPAWIKISCHLSQAGNSNYLFIQFTPHEMIKTFVGYYVAICFNPHELLLRVKWSKFFFITALEVESILALFSLFNLSNKKEKNSLHTSKSCGNDEILACSMLVCELASISHRYRVISFLRRKTQRWKIFIVSLDITNQL